MSKLNVPHIATTRKMHLEPYQRSRAAVSAHLKIRDEIGQLSIASSSKAKEKLCIECSLLPTPLVRGNVLA